MHEWRQKSSTVIIEKFDNTGLKWFIEIQPDVHVYVIKYDVVISYNGPVWSFLMECTKYRRKGL